MLGVIGGMSITAGRDFDATVASHGIETLRSDGQHPCRVAWLEGRGASPVSSIAKAALGLFEQGASQVVMACNTAHAARPALVDALPARFRDGVLDAVALTRESVRGHRPLWLGTTVLAHSTGLVRRGDIVLPDDRDQEIVQDAIWAAKRGTFPHSAEIRRIADGHLVVAGCTEVPAILRIAGVDRFVDPACIVARQVLH